MEKANAFGKSRKYQKIENGKIWQEGEFRADIVSFRAKSRNTAFSSSKTSDAIEGVLSLFTIGKETRYLLSPFKSYTPRNFIKSLKIDF